jgi:hypothetical protein
MPAAARLPSQRETAPAPPHTCTIAMGPPLVYM